MNHADLPSLPEAGAPGQTVCETVMMYLAVLPDLSAEQIQFVSEHVATCASCAQEQRLLMQARHLITDVAAFAPPAHVERAVRAAIATGANRRFPRQRRTSWLLGSMMAAALLLVVGVTVIRLLSGSLLMTHPTFALPAASSWNGYVLDYRETRVDANGVHSRIHCDHDLGTGRMRVETTTDRGLDIVVVGDEQRLLSEDLVHHIVQWGPNAWSVDDSMFNLAQLRSDLKANRAVYEGQDRFAGQEVYRIRWSHGLVLLLNKQYQPVNVLRDAHGPGTGVPIYEQLLLKPTSQVPNTLWEMSVPAGFQLGRLPEGP